MDSPFAAAISSFLSFAVGAAVPLLPFALTGGTAALAAGASLALLALFLAGAAASLFTGRGAVFSGLRMAAIGGGSGGRHPRRGSPVRRRDRLIRRVQPCASVRPEDPGDW